MNPPLRATLCALLPVLIAGPVAAQHEEDSAGLDCGSRNPIQYAVVFDASSSLRRYQEAVVDAYGRVLRVLSEALCKGDPPIQVFAFPHDGNGHVQHTFRLEGGGGQRELARDVARRLLRTNTPHSDLPMVLRNVARDAPGASVIFVVTDGSYYPRDLGGGSMSLDAVRDSLDALAGIAHDPRFLVIGVRAEQEPALDPALRTRLSSPAGGDWGWSAPGGPMVQLDTAHGGALLHALFGPRYQPIEELSLPRFLFAGSHGAWLRAAGYHRGEGLQISDLREVRVQHLVADPRADSATARCPRDRAFPGIVPRLAGAYGSREFCSIHAPDTATLTRLSRERWNDFAYRQAEVPGFAAIPASIYGYHQLILPAGNGSCTPADVEQHLYEGKAWPDSISETAWIRLVHLPDRKAETVGLVPLSGTGCLVAGGRAGRALRSSGPHLLYASVGDTIALKQVHLEEPRLAWEPELRFWAGGFPPSNAAWLHVCAGLHAPLDPGERLQFTTGGRSFELRPPGDKKCWAHGTRHQGHTFSSVIAVEDVRSSGYLSVTRTGTSQRTSPEIYPVVKEARGYFLLPLWLAGLLFSASCVLQCLFWAGQRRFGGRWRVRSSGQEQRSRGQVLLHGTSTLLRAGVLPLIVAEIFIVAFVTDRTGSFSHLTPAVIISATCYAAKLWIGFLLPEIMSDELTS